MAGAKFVEEIFKRLSHWRVFIFVISFECSRINHRRSYFDGDRAHQGTWQRFALLIKNQRASSECAQVFLPIRRVGDVYIFKRDADEYGHPDFADK